jgi:hypothetical protein
MISLPPLSLSQASSGASTGPTRRELRFTLELVIRNLYVDTMFASRETPLVTRMAYVEHMLGEEEVALLAQMSLCHYVDDSDSFKRTAARTLR